MSRLEELAEAMARKDAYVVGAPDDTLDWLVVRLRAAEQVVEAAQEVARQDGQWLAHDPVEQDRMVQRLDEMYEALKKYEAAVGGNTP